ncbi:MAG: hypothetical protein ACRC2I_03100 [Plesiomonas shigelloides]
MSKKAPAFFLSGHDTWPVKAALPERQLQAPLFQASLAIRMDRDSMLALRSAMASNWTSREVQATTRLAGEPKVPPYQSNLSAFFALFLYYYLKF